MQIIKIKCESNKLHEVCGKSCHPDTDFLPATKFATLNLFLLSLKITRHINTHPIIDPNIDKYPKDSMHILQICFTWSTGDVLFIDESYFMLYMDNSKSIDVNVLGKTTDSGMFFFLKNRGFLTAWKHHLWSFKAILYKQGIKIRSTCLVFFQ